MYIYICEHTVKTVTRFPLKPRNAWSTLPAALLRICVPKFRRCHPCEAFSLVPHLCFCSLFLDKLSPLYLTLKCNSTCLQGHS